LPARQYGQPVDLQKIRSNLTLTSLIAQDSAELAHFCGINPGIRHKIDQEREAQPIRVEVLKMQTDALMAKNLAAQQQREDRKILASWQRGYRSV